MSSLPDGVQFDPISGTAKWTAQPQPGQMGYVYRSHRRIITVGDVTSNGGVVVSGSSEATRINGYRPARVGDLVWEPGIGYTTIVANADSGVNWEGIPVAVEGMKTSSGATLIATHIPVNLDATKDSTSPNGQSDQHPPLWSQAPNPSFQASAQQAGIQPPTGQYPNGLAINPPDNYPLPPGTPLPWAPSVQMGQPLPAPAVPAPAPPLQGPTPFP